MRHLERAPWSAGNTCCSAGSVGVSRGAARSSSGEGARRESELQSAGYVPWRNACLI